MAFFILVNKKQPFQTLLGDLIVGFKKNIGADQLQLSWKIPMALAVL